MFQPHLVPERVRRGPATVRMRPSPHKIGKQSGSHGSAVGHHGHDEGVIARAADKSGYAPYRSETENKGDGGNHTLQPFLGDEQLDKHADGNENYGDLLQQRCRHIHEPTDHVARGTHVGLHSGGGAMQVDGEQDDGRADQARRTAHGADPRNRGSVFGGTSSMRVSCLLVGKS